MTSIVGPATWFVDAKCAEEYRAALEPLGGAAVVADALCEARNAALNAAFSLNAPCLQISDDLKKVERASWDAERGKYVAAPIAFSEAVATMLDATNQVGAKLAGVAPTANPFYYRGRAINGRAFVVGDLILTKPTPLRFDESLRLKEDYDYTLQHIEAHGVVARCDDVLATFVHRSNPGGAVAYRTDALEAESIAALKKKWGRLLRDNPRRPNEILLKL